MRSNVRGGRSACGLTAISTWYTILCYTLGHRLLNYGENVEYQLRREQVILCPQRKVPIDANWLKLGTNTIRFVYSTQDPKRRKSSKYRGWICC